MKKKWTITFLSIFVAVMLVVGVAMVIFDPYSHFHKPLPGVSYRLSDKVYQNDGICKNWDYDAIITGTSMTLQISTEQVDELFGTHSVRATFTGEGYRRINDNLESAFAHNDDIKLIIRCLDPGHFVCDWDFLEYGSYDAYPTYLYDEDWTNDFSYLYNMDIVKGELVPMIVNTIKGVPSDTFDGQMDFAEGGKDKVFAAYDRPEKYITETTQQETDEMMACLERNIERNVTSTIKEHPDTKFIIYFPPYGITVWDRLMQNGPGVVERRFDMEQYAIEQILECENVELYSFLDDFDITTNLDNYTDDIHYSADVSRYIIDTIGRTHEHRITKDNYLEYLEKSRNFYLNYDYDVVFGEMTAGEN